MRKSLVGALIASAFAFGGSAHAGLILDLNGSGAGGVVQANALDWAPTSFLARGGVTAISNFNNNACGANGAGCQFEVLTHALLTTYTETGSGQIKSALDFGQITMVARYTEQVVATAGGAFPSATFATTGAGTVEFYYNATAGTSQDLTGFGFNSGRLIGRLTGVDVGAIGTFLNTSLAPVALDGSSDGNQYTGQNTVRGTGSQDVLNAGLLGKDLDAEFFITTLAGFALNFENISIGLPYATTNPSDCFNDTITGRAVGTGGYTSTCDNNHVDGLYSAQANPTGYTPVIGPVNGFAVPGTPSLDFIAQTDFNSAVRGVPEPGSLALAGLALAALGVAASRRRRA